MFTRNKLNPFYLGMLVVCIAILIVAGCSKKTVVDDTPSGTNMTMTVSPSAIQTNNTAVVEATITSGTTPLPNRVVNFTVSPAGSGYFTPASDTTDATGVAATIFTATVSGSANISANVEGTSITGVRAVNISDAPQTGSGNITISVTPSLLLANGADTSVVTVTVRDGQGALAPNGTVVKLAAGEKFVDVDGNGYWTQNVDSIVYDANPNGLWDAIGNIPTTATVAGGAGVATANYISGSNALTVYVRATVDDNGITGNGEVQLQLSPDVNVNSIYLNSDSMQLSVKSTGGIESGYIHATCYDAKGNRVPQGIPVSFIITDGPGGGEHLENVGYGPYNAETNSQGIASVALHSGTISGTVRIRAYSDTVLSNATQVLISAGPPAYIVVGAEELNVPYWDNVAEENNIVAVVSDIYLNPVNDSEVVYFSTDEGSMKSHQNRTEDHEGIARTIWISGNNVPTADGIVIVSAETAGGTVSNTSAFINSHIVDTIYSTDMPTWIRADDNTKRVATIRALDLNGNFVIGGTQCEARAGFLTVTGGTFENGITSCSFESEITSQTLEEDHSWSGGLGGNDDGIGAIDYIRYSAEGGRADIFAIEMRTGSAYTLNCELQGQATAFPSEDVVLWVVIRDRYGNPLGDHTLTMSASQGTVSGAVQETDNYGEATGFLWTAPDSATSVSITVYDSDPLGDVTLTHGIVVEP